ncbi:MAG TPA: hypothetical protein VJG90_07930 [Candidatus Nanoarchaeia archaeon]|nr:hypothetical protein [Candidatus Nanoarchaeia archaeon]
MNNQRYGFKVWGVFLALIAFALIQSHLTAAVANFSVNITEIITTPTTVSQGQTGIVVDVKIANTGALGTDSENVNITNASLILHNGTYTLAHNVTSNYTISLQNVTPIILNGSALGGNTTYLRFLVNISRNAINQSILINATVNATNSSFAGLASGGDFTYEAQSRFGDNWTVQTPASLNITNISASPFVIINTLNNITISLNITNVGEATADVTAGSNVTNTTVLSFFANTTATAIQNFGVTRTDTVTTITGGANAVLQFTITKGLSTYEGNVTVNATLLFNDTNTVLVTPNAANRSSRDSAFQTLEPANFSVNITEIITTPTTVSQGQTGIVVDVKIANTPALGTDSAAANLTNITLILHNGTVALLNNVTSNYTISLQNTTPIIINGSATGGNTTYLRFLVNISRNAINQTIRINATVTAIRNSILGGANTTDLGLRFGDNWTVQTPASLNITNISASPFRLGGTNTITITLNVTNVGEATADVTSGSNVTNGSAQVARTLIFLNSSNSTYAALLTGFSVVRADSVSTIAGGDSAVIQFTIADGIETNQTNVTVNATLLFNDTNTGLVTPNGANKTLRDSTFQTDFTIPSIGGAVRPTSSGNTVSISFTTNEAATCTYGAPGIVGGTFSGSGGTSQTASFSASTGIHRFTITCTDLFENVYSFQTDFIDVGRVGGGGGGGGVGKGASLAASKSSASTSSSPSNAGTSTSTSSSVSSSVAVAAPSSKSSSTQTASQAVSSPTGNVIAPTAAKKSTPAVSEESSPFMSSILYLVGFVIILSVIYYAYSATRRKKF